MYITDDQKFEIMSHRHEQEELEKQEAVHFIQNCLTEIGQVGANDIEPSALRKLLEDLEQGKIPPFQARAEAATIYNRKHLDH